MQKRFLALAFVAILVWVWACNRKMTAEAATSGSALVGTWELREEQRGMIPSRQHQPGNGNRFRFTETTYEQFVNGALEKSGTWRVQKDSTAEKELGLQFTPGEFTHRIIFDDDLSSPKTFFQRTGEQLVLLSGYFPTDGGSRYTYQKVADSR